MITWLVKREQRNADRSEPRGHEDRIMTAFKVCENFFKVKTGRSPQ